MNNIEYIPGIARTDNQQPQYVVYCKERREFVRTASICAQTCPKFPCNKMETKYLPPFADLDWDNIAEINGTSYFYCSSRGCCTTGVICSYRCANVKKCRVVADYINKAREKEAMFDE